jgi:hypothetical protein
MACVTTLRKAILGAVSIRRLYRWTVCPSSTSDPAKGTLDHPDGRQQVAAPSEGSYQGSTGSVERQPSSSASSSSPSAFAKPTSPNSTRDPLEGYSAGLPDSQSTSNAWMGSSNPLKVIRPRSRNVNPFPWARSRTALETRIEPGSALAQRRAASCTAAPNRSSR